MKYKNDNEHRHIAFVLTVDGAYVPMETGFSDTDQPDQRISVRGRAVGIEHKQNTNHWCWPEHQYTCSAILIFEIHGSHWNSIDLAKQYGLLDDLSLLLSYMRVKPCGVCESDKWRKLAIDIIVSTQPVGVVYE